MVYFWIKFFDWFVKQIKHNLLVYKLADTTWRTYIDTVVKDQLQSE